ncbi:RHS repeat-associated core domain-containing protein [uncultured Microscilla sp.]|uniref:RHS repeat-associated core domain-containing protein n=1 Tax=uncultured Microscilla sp. TaxID=432653 RepID=UPI00262C4432|nr:RHS repeat-associated core domain-containing protein [uncultured Microscilla sp.]
MLIYQQNYTYDASTNLLALRHTQNGTTQARTQPMRARNNRQRLYTYDEAGNQLRTDTLDQLCYGADGQIGSIEWQQGGYKMREDYTYLQPGVRARKITRTWNAAGVLIALETVAYIGQVEKRASYQGVNLRYDGEHCTGYTTQHRWTVTRIKDGHGQVGKITKNELTGEETVTYNALNHLDSNELEVDEAGNLIRYTSYLPYGEPQEVIEADAEPTNELGYSGQEQDATGLYYYGYRYLQGESGLWNRADPIRFESGQLNLYGMLDGNPVSGRDEMGLSSRQRLLVFIQALMRETLGEQRYESMPISDRIDILKGVWRYFSQPGSESDFSVIQGALTGTLAPLDEAEELALQLGHDDYRLKKIRKRLKRIKKNKKRSYPDGKYVIPQLDGQLLDTMQINHRKLQVKDFAGKMLKIAKELKPGKKSSVAFEKKLQHMLATGNLDAQAVGLVQTHGKKYIALKAESIIHFLPEYLLQTNKSVNIPPHRRWQILGGSEKLAGTLDIEFSDNIRQSLIKDGYAGRRIVRLDRIFDQLRLPQEPSKLRKKQHFNYKFSNSGRDSLQQMTHNMQPENIKQTNLPFCHAYGALSSLVQLNPQFIRSIFVKLTDSKATLRFYNKGMEPIYVTISRTQVGGSVISDKSKKTYLYKQFHQEHIGDWVSLLEKAWVVAGFTGFNTNVIPDKKIKKHLSFAGLGTPSAGSWGSGAFMTVLAGKYRRSDITKEGAFGFPSYKSAHGKKIFKDLRKASEAGKVLTVTFMPTRSLFGFRNKKGLYKSHLYAIQGIQGDTVLLRNPHAHSVPKQTNNGQGDMTKMQYKIEELDESENTKGFFALSASDFMKVSSCVTIHHFGGNKIHTQTSLKLPSSDTSQAQFKGAKD